MSLCSLPLLHQVTKCRGRTKKKGAILIFIKFLCLPCLVCWGGVLFVFLIHWRNQQKMVTKKEKLFIILILEGETGGGDTIS